MQKWEYLTRFVWANETNWKARESIEFYNQEHGASRSDFKPRKYSPQYMISILNNMGEQGWELLHMEPVGAVGNNHDVLFTGDARSWSNVYFCVFKRPKP